MVVWGVDGFSSCQEVRLKPPIFSFQNTLGTLACVLKVGTLSFIDKYFVTNNLHIILRAGKVTCVPCEPSFTLSWGETSQKLTPGPYSWTIDQALIGALSLRIKQTDM